MNAALHDAGAFAKAEPKIRAFQLVPSLLPATIGATHHAELRRLFDEMFADSTCSVYLAGAGLHTPARMLMRRVLELGVAVVYLWDLPHEFWAWRDHDNDLSFSKMLDHLSSAPYRSYLKRDGATKTDDQIIDSNAAERIYGELSDTVHGKIAEFDVPITDRFEYSATDWKNHLELTVDVADMLVGLWRKRFPSVEAELEKRMPQLLR